MLNPFGGGNGTWTDEIKPRYHFGCLWSDYSQLPVVCFQSPLITRKTNFLVETLGSGWPIVYLENRLVIAQRLSLQLKLHPSKATARYLSKMLYQLTNFKSICGNLRLKNVID